MKKLLLIIAFAIFRLGLNAQNVGDVTTIDYDGYSLKFEITRVSPAECEVSDCTGSPTEVTIPSTVTISGIEFAVTSIGNSVFEYCRSLTSVTFGENSQLTSIGNCAFWKCSSLTSIEIPNSVTSIGYSAFHDCSSLTSIEIPNSVTSIGHYAFVGCSSLTSIEIPNSVTSIGYATFSSCSSLTVAEGNTVYDSRENCNAIIETSSNKLIAGCQNTVIPNSVTSIGDGAFHYCSSLTSIEIPNSITSIGARAFYSCPSLTSIVVEESNTIYDSRENCNAIIETSSNTLIVGCQNTVIPNSVTSIGDYAFYGCDNLTSIEIPNSITSIGDYAFYSCDNLTSIEIPNSVTSIGDEAFYDCDGLTSIEIPNSVIYIRQGAFSACSSLTSIEIPNSVTSIGTRAFGYCSSLTSIEIPNSVTSIGDEVFYCCKSLTSIVVAEGNTVYDSRDNCNAIIETSSNTLIAGCQNTVIPNSVTSIGDGAFGCSSLTSIEIPNSVTSIGDDAFSYCSSLKVIKCYAEDVPETGDDVFYNCPSDMIILVPSSSLSEYKSKSPWNEYIVMSGMSVIDYDGYSLIYTITDLENAECKVACAIKPTAPTTLTIPSSVLINETSFSVTSIPDSAFFECNKFIGDLVIPNTVKSVGIRAFRDCTGFTGSLTLSENLETIGDLAFAGGGDIEVNYTGNLIIPNSVTSIGLAAFQNCSSLTSVTFGEDSQLTSIGESAFYDCSKLTGDLTIPNGVTYIGQSAFWECVGFDGILTLPENLDTIHDCTFGSYNGTMALTGNVVIPETVKYIGDAAFQNCSSLENVTFGENSQLTYIGQWAFLNCSSLTGDLTIPNSVTYIGQSAFWKCVGFDGILTLPENLDTIHDCTFGSYNGTMALTGNVVIPETVKYIGNAAFQKCSSLENVTFGENSQLTYIGDYAFTNCNSLASIEIPSGVTYIGQYGLNCSSLKVIKCYAEDVPETGDNVFYNCPSDMIIYVPEVSLEDYKATSPWNEFTIVPLVAVCPAEVTLDVKAMPNEVTITATPNEHAVEFHFGLVTKASFEEKGLENLIQEIRNDGHPAFEQTSATWVNGIVPGGEYVALGSAKNSLNEWGETTIVHFTTPLEDDTPDPLDAPENLKATTTSASSISLSWDEVEKAESYNIYRGNELLNNVSTTTYKDNNLEADTTYCYTVTAIRDDKESEFSDEACATTFSINTEIEAPANLKAKAESTSSISLSWDEVEVAESYNIYRDGKLLKNVEKNSYTDKNLSENKKYCYTVSAVVNNEESAMSAEACAKTLEFTLDAPENFEANTEDSSSILLTWDEVENAESYNIYQDDELIDDTEDTEYLVKDLEADTKYCFYVTAVNGSKESDESDKDCDRTDKEKEDDDDEGIEELSSSINIYPNPVENELILATEVRVEEIAIYDIYGRLTMRQQVNETTSQQVVEVAELEAGVYFVNIKTENGNVVKRFVKN